MELSQELCQPARMVGGGRIAERLFFTMKKSLLARVCRLRAQWLKHRVRHRRA